MADRLNLLLFGGCLLHEPFGAVPSLRSKISFSKYGPVTGVHSFGEMLQVIEVLRGQKDVPLELRHLCRMSPRLRAVPRAKDFRDIDVALLEPASPIEITFRGISVNRNAIMKYVVVPLREVGREAAKCATAWFRQGLTTANEQVRSARAAELLEYVPGDLGDGELIRALISETRSSREIVLDGFRKMQELLQRPIGVVIYIFQYMPDGRAVSFPPGFHEEVLAAALQLGFPVFEPSEIVKNYGVGAALSADLRHYSESFHPVIAEALAKFAESIVSQSALRTPV